jgi:UDP-glucuronate 4-epimerase
MALHKFAQAIVNDEIIKIFNYGNHRRDFTYIDDIVEGLSRVLERPASPNQNWSSDNPDPATSRAPWRVYNIGNNCPVNLLEYIRALEKTLGKEARKDFLPMQPGDVLDNYADIDDLIQQFNYRPVTNIEEGIGHFATWFRDYFKV